jgi:two-component system sensor histidine kinase/response regulator
MMLPHELRTPLNGILAYGEILVADAETISPKDIAEMGQVIHDSGKRLERLIENFLIYAQLELLNSDPQYLQTLLRKQTPQPVPLIEQSAQEQAELAKRSGDLRLDLANVALPISDEYLSKVVEELVQNAFKFSSPGSPVHVKLIEANSHVNLSVSDVGRGFSTEHITKVGAYMQFDRKLHEQQGLGLGLTIVRRLTELHGGTLTIQSEKGVGTSVIIKFPKVVETGDAPAGSKAPASHQPA